MPPKLVMALTPQERSLRQVGDLFEGASSIEDQMLRLQSYNLLLQEKGLDRTEYLVTAINSGERRRHKSQGKTEFELQIADKVSRDFGLSPEALVKLQTLLTLPEYDVIDNIRSMLELEVEKPGSVKLLVEDYGITFFSRYPKALLQRQISEGLLIGEPYALMIYSRADHNGAFRDPSKLVDLFKQCRKYKVPVRLIETGDTEELESQLNMLRERFGEYQASLVVFSAHGTPNAIQLGINHMLLEHDLKEGTVGEALYRTVLPGAESMMWSCSTGESFARTVSMVTSGRSFGPNIPAVSKALKLEQDSRSGRLRIRLAEYQYGLPERVKGQLRFVQMLGAIWNGLTQTVPKSEFRNGNLVTSRPIHDYMRSASLAPEDVTTLVSIAERSLGGENFTAVGILSRYTGVARKEGGQREQVIKSLGQVALRAKDKVTRLQTLLALKDTLIYFMSEPEKIMMDLDFSNPSGGTEEVVLRTDVDAESALYVLDTMEFVAKSTMRYEELMSLNRRLVESYNVIKDSTDLPGKDIVLVKLIEIQEVVAGREASVKERDLGY